MSLPNEVEIERNPPMDQVVLPVQISDSPVRGANIKMAAVKTRAQTQKPLNDQKVHSSETPARPITPEHDLLSYTDQSIPCHTAAALLQDFILNQDTPEQILLALSDAQ